MDRMDFVYNKYIHTTVWMLNTYIYNSLCVPPLIVVLMVDVASAELDAWPSWRNSGDSLSLSGLRKNTVLCYQQTEQAAFVVDIYRGLLAIDQCLQLR